MSVFVVSTQEPLFQMDESIRNIDLNIFEHDTPVRKPAYAYLKNYFTKQSILMKHLKPIHLPKQIVHGFTSTDI
jgi:hypothetical protein